MHDLREQVERAILDRELLRQKETLLVAVSGGIDSMALLHLLHELSQKHRWRLHVAHFNHCLRDDSNADEELVKQTAGKLSFPFFADRADVRAHAQAGNLSIEMAARQLRHQFLATTAKKHRIRRIALAHHADDQVELFFLRLLRGAGLEGLGGMQWASPSPADPQIQLIRPMLECAKADLQDYAASQKIAFRDDPTNQSRDILRNRIRHELLPLLAQQYQPAVANTTLRLMEIIRGESEVLDAILNRSDFFGEGAFLRAPLALQRRIIQHQLIALGLTPNFSLIEHLRQSETRIMVQPEKIVFRDDQGHVQLKTVARSRFESDRLIVSLTPKKGEFRFANVSINWQIFPAPLAFAPGIGTGLESFDADKIGDSIVLRHWQRGDRFQPIGMPRLVKLQDFFVNQKVRREMRHKLLIAATVGEIIWVEGLRISDRFKLDKLSKNVLKWSWRRG